MGLVHRGLIKEISEEFIKESLESGNIGLNF